MLVGQKLPIVLQIIIHMKLIVTNTINVIMATDPLIVFVQREHYGTMQ